MSILPCLEILKMRARCAWFVTSCWGYAVSDTPSPLRKLGGVDCMKAKSQNSTAVAQVRASSV